MAHKRAIIADVFKPENGSLNNFIELCEQAEKNEAVERHANLSSSSSCCVRKDYGNNKDRNNIRPYDRDAKEKIPRRDRNTITGRERNSTVDFIKTTPPMTAKIARCSMGQSRNTQALSPIKSTTGNTRKSLKTSRSSRKRQRKRVQSLTN